MMQRSLSTSYSTNSTTHSEYFQDTTTTPRPLTSRNSTRAQTRAKTPASTGHGDQQIICAIIESRGISPTVGLAFVNLSTTEAVLCQISDNQTYMRTLHKIWVFQPTEILFPATAVQQTKSPLFSIIEANIPNCPIVPIDRKYWAETTGVDYVQQLAFKKDVEALKVSIEGNFYAICCIAAVFKYVELIFSISFPFHSVRIKYEPSEGAMMIDLSTIHSLELIQNLQNAKSKDCLFGILNQTSTPMGSRLLRSNILQPLTETDVLEKRFNALEELAAKEEMFFASRQALKAFLDAERILTAIIIIPTKPTIAYWEQSINNVIMLKQYIKSIPPIFEALASAKSELLLEIRQLCAPEMIADALALIDQAINPDTTYQSKPLDLRNQRTYAVKAGVNGLLDVARQTYKEANNDANDLIRELGNTYGLALEMKYESARQYYIQIPVSDLENRNLPDEFINKFRRKNVVECQTLDLVKWNQKIIDSHHEVLQMSDRVIQELIDKIREDMSPLFQVSEGVAMLDMISSFAQLVTTRDYCRPELQPTLAIKSGRHPIHEKIHADRFIPNDAYATQQTRFQIITGCNMSGKSTYIRSIALMAVMAQTGCFVPATYASFPIRHQLFARVSMDDSIEANVSTFSAEMRETAFILRNVDKRSMVIIDELGRGTSTRDGLAIAIAIAEALVDSRALVWFATHFRDLAKIMAERPGVVNLHLAVEMSTSDKMMMLYKIEDGHVREDHYGLALAKVLSLPPGVIAVAEEVSEKLTRNSERKKSGSRAIVLAKRRKLILSLREQLVQAHQGAMSGEALRRWMKALQDEFVLRMDALDAEAAAFEAEPNDDEASENKSKTEDVTVADESSSVIRTEINRAFMSGALQTRDSETASDIGSRK